MASRRARTASRRKPCRALDADHVYWGDFAAERVARVGKSGGAPETIAAGLYAGALAVDATRVFVEESPGGVQGTIAAIPLDGGSATILVSGNVGREALAADEQRLNFAEGITDLQVLSISKEGGPVNVLAQNQSSVTALAVDGSCVYWVAKEGVWKAPRE
jgi:hypothetical protein